MFTIDKVENCIAYTNTNRVFVENIWLRLLDASSSIQGLRLTSQGSKIQLNQDGKHHGCKVNLEVPRKGYGENDLWKVMFLFFSPGYFKGFLSGSAINLPKI